MEKRLNGSCTESELDDSSYLLRHKSPRVRTYWQRWLVLALFAVHIFVTNFVYTNFSPVAVLVGCYYNVDLYWVNALPCAFLITYVLLAFPASWFIKQHGLKLTAVVGGCVFAAGSWLRVAGTDPGLYWVQLLGYSVVSLTNVLEFTACSLLSSVWFPSGERGIATAVIAAVAPALAVFGGLCVGPFVLQSPTMEQVCSEEVSRTSPEFLDWQMAISHQLFYYLLAQAIVASVVLPVAFFIPSAPPTAPSLSTLFKQEVHEEAGLLCSCSQLVRNIPFLLFLVFGGVFVGAGYCFPIVYAQILVCSGYTTYQDEIGYSGLALAILTIIGLLLVGKWIDCTKTFHASSAVVCTITTLLFVGLAISLHLLAPFYVVVVLIVLSGTCLSLYQAVVFDYGAEIAYPIHESITMGIISFCSQFIALAMVAVTSLLLDMHIDRYSMWFFVAALFLATVLNVVVRPETKRVQLEHSDRSKSPLQGPLHLQE